MGRLGRWRLGRSRCFKLSSFPRWLLSGGKCGQGKASGWKSRGVEEWQAEGLVCWMRVGIGVWARVAEHEEEDGS